MKPLRSIAALLIALAASGCGAASVIQQHNVEDTQSATDITAAFAAMQAQCAAEVKSPEIDPIRDKINFEGDARSPPVRLLVLKDKPTPREAQALLAWGAAREKCMKYFHAGIAALPLPPSMDPEIKERAKLGLNNVVDNAFRGGNYLTAALYEKKLTYGEFNKQRADLTAKLVAEHTAWVEAWVNQDKASTLQKAAVAQQQADAAVAVLQAAASVACASTKNRTVQAMC
jgi:hypothetical protein